MALLPCTRKPRLTRTLPASSTHGTRNVTTRSCSTNSSSTPFSISSGRASTTGSMDSSTLRTVIRNWASFGLRCSTRFIRSIRYAFFRAIICFSSQCAPGDLHPCKRRKCKNGAALFHKFRNLLYSLPAVLAMGGMLFFAILSVSFRRNSKMRRQFGGFASAK